MAATSPNKTEQSVRDRLALERTVLANERTLLAYARTAIMLAATGATLLKLYSHSLVEFASGWLLIAAGIGVAAIGASKFRKLARSLR